MDNYHDQPPDFQQGASRQPRQTQQYYGRPRGRRRGNNGYAGYTSQHGNNTNYHHQRNAVLGRQLNGTTYYHQQYENYGNSHGGSSSGHEEYNNSDCSSSYYQQHQYQQPNEFESHYSPQLEAAQPEYCQNLSSEYYPYSTDRNGEAGQFKGNRKGDNSGLSSTSWRNDNFEGMGNFNPEDFAGASALVSSTNSNSGDNHKTVSSASSTRSRKSKLVLKEPSAAPKEFENQRDLLTDQLSRNNYECMVCCAKVFRRERIWSCGNCFNIFHLACIKKWVNSSAIDGSWRCPGCQNVVDVFPENYVCFCGKTPNPPVNHDVPHSCNLVCGKVKSGGPDCTHSCSLQCHPGPCPPCTDLISRKCECGKTSAFVQCSSKSAFVCGSPCEKPLNCEVHFCTANCHPGPCINCKEKISLECHCQRNRKEVLCSKGCTAKCRPSYACQEICDKLLNCKYHKCPHLCHPDLCSPCPTSTDVVISCPCGQTGIFEACSTRGLPPRTSCLDAIPTCGKICKKILTCGPIGKNHRCENQCHLETPCPPCLGTTTRKCRCGNQENDIRCKDLQSCGDFLCSKKCVKKRSCGRHKCNTNCCVDTDHICHIVCDKPLRCGNHRCEALCHIGHCHTCSNVSFEELRCECGTAVIYPPVPCGTKPPPCIKPCGREHACEHPVAHHCHSDPTCPPCSHLTEKWCYGKHEFRKNVLCHVTNVSCGNPCQKILGCSRHKCPKICHPGQCQKAGDICKLPCSERRKTCGHACAAPCHDGLCPDTKCKETVEAVCACGRRKESLMCWKREIEFDRVVAGAVAAGINDLFLEKNGKNEGSEAESDSTVESLTASIRKEKSKATVLECDRECARIERNRKMAQALQLENPDVETRLGPPDYSDFSKRFAQKYPQFVEMVHSKLTAIVMQVKKSKNINLTFAFDSMNRDKRQLIHDYSDHFGCLSESFDEEPNRNVIVTASKEKSYLPSVSLIDVVFGKSGHKTDRKNVHQDLELVEQPKTQIIGPSNRKLIPKTSSKMVCLNGS